MANHMVIGLGGTGGKIIRSLRTLIYQNCRQEDPPGVSLRYLYVDSSDELMAHDDPTWKVLGRSVQLKRSSQLLIRGLNLGDVIDNLARYPGISPWLGDSEQFRSIITSADAANIIGGQKRRLGRFLFACKVASFREQLQALVRDMQTGGTTETVFHVCCGLAGGTGSGSLPDAVCQIRDLYSDPSNYKILIYAFLPEKDPPGYRAGDNYHANGYAALLELNALGVGTYRPYDLAAASPRRLKLQDPFNCCYLFTDENQSGNRVDIDIELPSITASFLYQKIVAVQKFTWDSLRRQESFELGKQAKFPETSPVTGRPERSRLFFSFGVKQIAYPEEEIRELLSYEFARQAALQLRFNHWTDASGYVGEPVNQGFSEYVRQKETLENWRLSDEHVCLSLGILTDEAANKRWKPVARFWTDLLPNFKTHVRDSSNDRKVWLDELSKLCETAFAQNYRDLGVRKFYETKSGDIGDQAKAILRRVETELFTDWRTGVKSMHDVSRLLRALAEFVGERIVAMDDKVARARDNEVSAEAKVAHNRQEWTKIGKLSDLMGKRDRIFDAQAECLTELYIHRTRVHGWQFAKKLFEAVRSDLTSLESEAQRTASMMADAIDAFESAINARCADQGETDRTRQVVRFYDPAVVGAFSRRLTRDRAVQARQTGLVRQAIARLVREDQRFATFNKRVTADKFSDTLISACDESAVSAHNDLISTDPTTARVLNVNIIEKLHRQYGGNREALRTFVIDVVSRARTFLPLKESEIAKKDDGIPGGANVSVLTIIMPETKEEDFKEFREVLADELANAKAGEKEVITGGIENEITLVDVTNVLAVRFVGDLDFLRSRYEARIRALHASLELHGEGDGSQFPSLHIRTVGPKDVLPYILLALAMGAVRVMDDEKTGQVGVYLIGKSEGGRDVATLLGSTVDEAVQSADLSRLDLLETHVSTALASEYLHRSRRQELAAGIQAQVDEVKLRSKGLNDRRYLAYVEAADKADTILDFRPTGEDHASATG